jgi:hypothetical protein
MVDTRLIPGGRFDAPPIGMNAFDRSDLPSGGVAVPAVNRSDDPDMSDEEASRAPFAPERRLAAEEIPRPSRI